MCKDLRSDASRPRARLSARPETSALRQALGWIGLALPLIAALALPFVTSGRPAIVPFAAAGFAAAAVCVAAAFGGGARRPWDFPLAGLVGLAAGHLLLAPGAPHGHDLHPHAWGLWAFLHEVGFGNPFPRWLHGVGLGLPLLQFYGPLSFYVMLPLAALGLSAPAALKGSLLGIGCLAAMAMYAVVRRWTGDRRAALVAAAGYAFAPYRLLDSHYRAALGESGAFVVLPLVFGAVDAALERGGRRRFSLAALAVAALTLVHPVSLVMTAPALAVWVTAAAVSGRLGLRRWLVQLGGLAVILALGLALAGFFALPLAAEARHVSYDRASSNPRAQLIEQHGLRPRQLLARQAWTELRHSQPAGEASDRDEAEMPFYVGLGLVSLLALGAGAGRLPSEDPPVPRQPGAPLAAVALVALTATLAPAAPALARLPLLRDLQFPWRFLTVATFALAALAGLAAARLLAAWRHRKGAAAAPALLALLLITDGFPYTGAADWLPPSRGLAHYYRRDRDCGRRWGCWETAVVAHPYPWRVRGSFLPPADPRFDVAAVNVYPEYLNRQVRTHLDDAPGLDALARWGVGLHGAANQPGVDRLQPTAYARWLAGSPESAWDEPGVERRARRGQGRIDIDLDGRAGTIVVLEQFFPGWVVETARGWRPAAATREGLLRAPVAAGQKQLRLRFTARRWDRAGGWLLSGATALALFAPWRRRRLTAASTTAPAARAPGGAPGST